MGGKSRIIHSVQQDLNNLEEQANAAYGPERYVIRSMSSLVSSLLRLETAVEKTTYSVDDLAKTIKNLDDKNTKLQHISIWLGIIGTIFTIFQIVQVIDIVWRWLH